MEAHYLSVKLSSPSPSTLCLVRALSIVLTLLLLRQEVEGAQATPSEKKVSVELFADHAAVRPGDTIVFGLLFGIPKGSAMLFHSKDSPNALTIKAKTDPKYLDLEFME